jgi:hypothetical protein
LGDRKYYYFVSTLPSIDYGDMPPMSSEEFRAQCLDQLHEADAELIRYCYYNPLLAIETVKSTGSEFIDCLMARERTLVLNLAYLRAGKLKRPSPGDPPHDVPRAEAVAKAVFEMDDPLEAAIFIDKSRWEALDDMLGLDPFGVNNVFAYLMKLQLLERRQCFDAEVGAVKFKELYDSILNAYNSRV